MGVPRPSVRLLVGRGGRRVSLSGAEALAFSVVWEFWRVRGRRCFTYSSILRFYEDYCRREGLRYKPQTFERRLRKLREYGVLYSFKGRLGTVFCLQPGLEVEGSQSLRVPQGVAGSG